MDAHLGKLEQLSKSARGASDLSNLLDTTWHFVNALKNLGQAIEAWDYWLVYKIVNCLDADSKVLWGAYIKPILRADDNSEGDLAVLLPTFKQITSFLEDRIEALETGRPPKPDTGKDPTPNHHIRRSGTKVFHAVSSGDEVSSCVICSKQRYYLARCEQFKSMTPHERYDQIKNINRCYNCLGTHYARDCKSKKRCNLCSMSHHSLLHDAYDSSSKSQETKMPSPEITS